MTWSASLSGERLATHEERRNMTDINETRRRFMTHFAGIGLGATLAPGVVWARMQDAK